AAHPFGPSRLDSDISHSDEGDGERDATSGYAANRAGRDLCFRPRLYGLCSLGALPRSGRFLRDPRQAIFGLLRYGASGRGPCNRTAVRPDDSTARTFLTATLPNAPAPSELS